jgi:hypothetical protein
MATKQTTTWTPPTDPDASKIYEELAEDRRAQRYEDALSKTLWFYEHALEHEPAMSGVRRSFALAEWINLGETYPPAMAALCAARDAAEDNVRSGLNVSHYLSDAVALNRVLEEQTRDVALFKWLDTLHPDLARANFALYFPSMVEAREYALCSKYMDAEQLLRSAAGLFATVKEQAATMPACAEVILGFSADRFRAEAATIVAVLALADRHDDAQRLAIVARLTLDDCEMDALLTHARNGEMPKSWPDEEMRSNTKSMREEMRKLGL